jgi:hypothetical protein
LGCKNDDVGFNNLKELSMNKLSLSVLLALGISPMGIHAAPLYFLMEGTVIASDAVCCGTPPPIGSAFKYQAVWDDQYMFGADVDPDSQKALFGNVGYTGYTVKETPVEGGYITEYKLGNYYTTKAGQYYFDGTSSGTRPWIDPSQHSRNWNLQLQTEKTLTGDKIILSYSNTYSGVNYYGWDSADYQVEFDDPSGVALKSNLLEFNWSAAGAGSGIATNEFRGGGHGGYFYGSDSTVQLTRLVLSYNPADVAAVPVPGAIWLMGSALLGLFGLSRRKI